jgi:hypothetical protein
MMPVFVDLGNWVLVRCNRSARNDDWFWPGGEAPRSNYTSTTTTIPSVCQLITLLLTGFSIHPKSSVYSMQVGKTPTDAASLKVELRAAAPNDFEAVSRLLSKAERR